jgi:hypothetical protein
VYLVIAAVLLAVCGVAAAGVSVPTRDLLDQSRRFALILACAVVGLSCLAAALLLRRGPKRPTALGWLSAVFSLLCLAATICVWTVTGADDSTKHVPGTLISNNAQADAFLAVNHQQRQTRVPTGVLIETAQFSDANNVKLTGFVWQRLPASADPEVPQLLLPDAVDGGVGPMVYQHRLGGQQVVGWQLRATVRQPFDYRHYPFDRQVIRLTMWATGYGNALVPDFDAYPPWQKHRNMGLYRELVSGDWHTQFTTFAMNEVDDQTSYGNTAVSVHSTIPDLHFNIGVARNFLSPLLDRLIPLLVIACLVFASLFVVTTDSDRRSLAGFSTWTVIGFCGAMMLVVAVQHSSLRSQTGSGSVVYAEYFYFILYLVIALTALNVVDYTANSRFRLVAWRGNLAARLLYWPIAMGLVLAATIGVFLL